MGHIRYTDEALSILRDPLITHVSAAEMLGCSDTTIVKHRLALGMKPRKKPATRKGEFVTMPKKYMDIARELACMTPAEIVHKLDVSSSYARRILIAAKRYTC